MKKFISMTLVVLLLLSALPMSVFAATMGTDDYYTVISENKYSLAPGATETELVVNNAAGNDRKVVHYFEVDTKDPDIEVLPGYYGIDKLDPDNLALEGVEDKSQYWKAEQLTKTVAYYEGLGYNVVGAMNTALAYDSNAPYGYMVMNGVVLGTPEVHKGAKTYLAIDAEGNCELRSMSTPLDGTEVTAISANFGWLVKDGEFVDYKTLERTSSDASRSMIGIKEDGTLVFCQVDGRNAPVSTGLSNYEMGEMMLALGCVNAVNCDGGGSSTFISKREGETENTMRSIPSDGAERATINSVILVSNAKPTGVFDHAVLSTDYDFYAPGTSAIINAQGVDASGSPADVPAEGITWAVSDSAFGTISDGVFTSNGTKGDVTVQMLYNGNVVGEKLLHIVDPDVFALSLDETVLPYGKSMIIDFACTYGADDWAVCVDGAYTLTLSDSTAATVNGNVITGSTDESVAGVDVTATYIPDNSISDVLKITYGKGSEVIYDFEDGERGGFVGFDEAKQYSIDNGINNTLVGSSPLDGQFNKQIVSDTFVTDTQVKNGNYALAWSLDNTDATFGNWSYNVLFNIGESIVLRDVENGKNATKLGMWLYIPEGATGLAFQSQLYTKNTDGTLKCVQSHFTFTTVNGAVKNLNSCTEADIPESRWVYASIDISGYDYLCTPVASSTDNTRTPSFIRTYIKPMVPAVHTFYIDDITLDYSSAVDDRVLPSISNVSYAVSDEAVALNEGATISGNSVAFSAVVADNAKLDNSTAKILVDGNALSNVSVSGKYLASEQVALLPGVHTVTFEIADTLGNLARVTRTFTIAGDAVITLAGHNDSGELAEIDSIYYVAVNVADINNINNLTAELSLQDANTWEPEGMTVAEGFKATYEIDKVENILTLNIERDGNAIDATSTTLASVPVRLWSWDGIDHVTGVAIAPEAQYATGYCPIVTIDCEVLTGKVDLASGYNNCIGAFGGEISVDTKINDIVNPWHTHDAELTVLNKEATCVADGYENRTYCETCQSVIDWGTVVEKTGHNHVVNGDALVCDKCEDTINSTGVVKVGGNMYYLIGGKLATGWQSVGSDWVYSDPNTGFLATGARKIDGITFNFGDDGILTTGTWYTNSYGTRYYYGPSYYKRTWQVIDGDTYWFEADGYTVSGYFAIKENVVDDTIWYLFAEDGKLIERVTKTGFIDLEDGRHYVVNGVATHAGLVLVDGDYYYINSSCMAVVGEYTINEGWTNGYLPAGTYQFGEDGKMIIVAKDGFVTGEDGNLYYYVNDVLMKTGLTKIDGNYYYISTTNGKVAVNVTRQVAYNC
ncbi:MAG: phosphodiester glycosidase family protein, partial [Ruminococcus sp.]|nr:phosphodiester glycosidase family protein [Ruminococcus sp.]